VKLTGLNHGLMTLSTVVTSGSLRARNVMQLGNL